MAVLPSSRAVSLIHNIGFGVRCYVDDSPQPGEMYGNVYNSPAGKVGKNSQDSGVASKSHHGQDRWFSHSLQEAMARSLQTGSLIG